MQIYNWAKENLKPEDGGWLAGLMAGEGCFFMRIQSRLSWWSASAQLMIKLRADDRGALKEVKRLWQIDTRIRLRAQKGKCDMVDLTIAKIGILRNRIIPTFRLYPLRAKKHRDFEIWAEAVEIIYQKNITKVKQFKSWEKERLEEIEAELKAVREFIEPSG